MVIVVWLLFLVLILLCLAIDLGVFNRKAHVVSLRESALWTAVWIAVSLLFNVGIYFLYEYNILGIGQETGHAISGSEAAIQFFTGYVLEKSLSLDNIFVIALIFGYFNTPAIYQHRVLFWGIVGAILLRGLMIGIGTALIHQFEWIIYVFGGLLILTAFKMIGAGEEKVEPEKNIFVRLAKKIYPVSPELHGEKFFVVENGQRMITPLFITLLVVESSDILFAVDSIPAIFAITQDPFIVFTSNIFAILGLRALYFVLASVLRRFRYMKISLFFVLFYVGFKML
ncbi:MAG: TerC family protein, partial [bacterium]|nr:TerC family protein [bacterium]